MVQLNREEFRMALPAAVAAAVDIVQASVAFAPVDNDVPAATVHLQRFYDKARHSAGLRAEAQTLAALEMDYRSFIASWPRSANKRRTTQATSSRWWRHSPGCTPRCSLRRRRRSAGRRSSERRPP